MLCGLYELEKGSFQEEMCREGSEDPGLTVMTGIQGGFLACLFSRLLSTAGSETTTLRDGFFLCNFSRLI